MKKKFDGFRYWESDCDECGNKLLEGVTTYGTGHYCFNCWHVITDKMEEDYHNRIRKYAREGINKYKNILLKLAKE